MDIRPPRTFAEVMAAGDLFDDPPDRDATERFLGSDLHHILFAYEDETAVGFITGVEQTHPDKGTEMFLYELGVDESSRNRGIGRTLVRALAGIARARGCYGMYVLTDDDNEPALRTYAAAAGQPAGGQVMFEWEFEDDSATRE